MRSYRLLMPDNKHQEHLEKYLIWEFFDFARSGFFVDVGAYHSTLHSQTWFLEQMGWKGILIEPQPDRIEELRAHRPASIVHQVAVSSPDKTGTATFYVNEEFSSLVPNVMDNRRVYKEEITVAVTTLDDILEREGNPPVDFLSIDVEGTELDCLNGFSIERHRPRLIITEDVVLTLDLHRYLLSHGYRLFRRIQWENWYVPRDCERRTPLLERLRLFRKMVIGTPLRAWKFKRERARLGKTECTVMQKKA